MTFLKIIINKIVILILLLILQSSAVASTEHTEVKASSAPPLKVAMGASLPPMHFINAQGRLVGFEVELAQLFAAEINRNLELINPYQHKTSSLNLLLDKKVNMALNSLSITEDRKQWVNFSSPYFNSPIAMLTNENADISNNVSSLTLLNINNKHSVHGSPKHKALNHVYVDSLADTLKLISEEKYPDFKPYVYFDEWLVLNKLKNKHVKIQEYSLGKQEYGAAFNKDEFQLLTQWNQFLKEIKQDGRLQALHQQWFSQLPLPNKTELVLSKRPNCWNKKPQINWKKIDKLQLKKGELNAYLPLLGCSKATIKDAHTNDKSAYDKTVLPLIDKNYEVSSEDYLVEVFYKSDNRNKFELFQPLILQHGIAKLAAIFIHHRFEDMQDNYKYFLSAFYLQYPDKHSELISIYKQIVDKKSDQIQWSVYMSEISAKLSIITTENVKKTIPLTPHYKQENSIYNINILRHSKDGKPLIEHQGHIGTFDKLVFDGQYYEGNKILDIKGNQIGFFQHSGEIEDLGDGQRLILKKEGVDLHYQLTHDAVTHIYPATTKLHKLITNPINQLKTQLWLNGYRDIKELPSSDAKKYLLYKEQVNSKYQPIIAIVQDNKVLQTHRLPMLSRYVPKYIFIQNNKLFLASIGYDDSFKPQVYDLKTGKLSEIEKGVNAGALVPISGSSLLYCSHRNHMLVRSLPLQFEVLNPKKELPCPNKTGEYLPFSKDGYFIFRDWSLC